jgi:hypothetical protein
MKRRSNKSMNFNFNFCIICILFLIIILMGIYIIGGITRENKTNNQTHSQPEIATAFVGDSFNYDYYNFLPRRLFRNFYDYDYDYQYRDNRPVIVQQDTKPIYINVPSTSQSSQQPPQQNNLNLYNYANRQEPKTISTENFQMNIPSAPTISPPPLSGVSSSSLSSLSESQEV